MIEDIQSFEEMYVEGRLRGDINDDVDTGPEKPTNEIQKEEQRELKVKFLWVPSTETLLGHNRARLIKNVHPETPPIDIVNKLRLPQYDRVVFIMGGADKQDEVTNKKILDLLTTIFNADELGKPVLITGGTESGIINVVGEVRKNRLLQRENDPSTYVFPAVGVFPKESVIYQGNTTVGDASPIENYHSHLVPVASKPGTVKEWGAWGNETEMMYKIGSILAEKVPSMGICANGGSITVDEVIENMKQGREVILLKGTKRAANVLTLIVEGKEDPVVITDGLTKEEKKAIEERIKLRKKFIAAAGDNLEEWKKLLVVVDIHAEDAAQQVLEKIKEKMQPVAQQPEPVAA